MIILTNIVLEILHLLTFQTSELIEFFISTTDTLILPYRDKIINQEWVVVFS